MERYRILIWIGVIHHDTFRFPGDIKIEILKRRFQKWIFIHSDKYVAKIMDAVRDPIVLREAEISSFLLIWTLFARNDFEIDKKPYVIEKMIFFLFMGAEFFYK